MYLAVDIGGTKTLVAVFSTDGKIISQEKFKTNQDYKVFLQDLKSQLTNLDISKIKYGAVAVPGFLDRTRGIVKGLGNLAWINEPIREDIEKLVKIPITIENDSKLGGLSEARLIQKDYDRVLYMTISTGVGFGLISGGVIDQSLIDMEGGHIILEHKGRSERWETFISGKAIVKKYGKRAAEIDDPEIWKSYAEDVATGLYNLIAVCQPKVVIIGGGVGAHFHKFGRYLEGEVKKFEDQVVPIPPIIGAKRAEEAVIYGCYELAKQADENTNK